VLNKSAVRYFLALVFPIAAISFDPIRIQFTLWYCQQETGDDPTELYQQMKWGCKAFNDRLNRNILRDFDSEGISLVLVGREEDWRAASESQPHEKR
jgi:hypothetical protein